MELWCSISCAHPVAQLCAYYVGFVRSLYELHPISSSAYHFSLGSLATVGLGPDVDVPSASKGICDFSKISTLVVVTIFNLDVYRWLKVDWENLGFCHGVIVFIAGMHAIRVEYQPE